MEQRDFARAAWRKSSRSSGNGQCVEVADLTDSVAIRDSKNQRGPILVFTSAEWTVFIAAVKGGEFDHE